MYIDDEIVMELLGQTDYTSEQLKAHLSSIDWLGKLTTVYRERCKKYSEDLKAYALQTQQQQLKAKDAQYTYILDKIRWADKELDSKIEQRQQLQHIEEEIVKKQQYLNNLQEQISNKEADIPKDALVSCENDNELKIQIKILRKKYEDIKQQLACKPKSNETTSELQLYNIKLLYTKNRLEAQVNELKSMITKYEQDLAALKQQANKQYLKDFVKQLNDENKLYRNFVNYMVTCFNVDLVTNEEVKQFVSQCMSESKTWKGGNSIQLVELAPEAKDVIKQIYDENSDIVQYLLFEDTNVIEERRYIDKLIEESYGHKRSNK